MVKRSIFAGLGDYYSVNETGLAALHFIYKNIADLSARLTTKSWVTTVPFVDDRAEKKSIVQQLMDTIDGCAQDDWILFYYTGHGSKYFLDNGNAGFDTKTYCVTADPQLKFDFLPPLDDFLSEIDYATVTQHFATKVPNGHLITVLDCCFAAGIVQNFSDPSPFHTVIAATSAVTKAFYNNNSIFFKAFSQCLDLPFDAMQARARSLMSAMQSPATCLIQPAVNFSDQIL